MDRLPAPEPSSVDQRKLTEYLLAPDHPVGRAKARFFYRCGFRKEEWQRLRDALITHARENAVTRHEVTRFGVKYIVEGRRETPDHRQPLIRTVWLVATGDERPRLITAHPMEGPSR